MLKHNHETRELKSPLLDVKDQCPRCDWLRGAWALGVIK